VLSDNTFQIIMTMGITVNKRVGTRNQKELFPPALARRAEKNEIAMITAAETAPHAIPKEAEISVPIWNMRSNAMTQAMTVLSVLSDMARFHKLDYRLKFRISRARPSAANAGGRVSIDSGDE
jgi:hypothetical protein